MSRHQRLGMLMCSLLMASCTTTAAPSPSQSSGPATPSATGAGPTPAATESALCPSAELGACLGPLAAGTYTTSEFATEFTYSVPEGWAHYEDLAGNFLLLPPGGELLGVNGDTSEFIGLYDGVAPAAASCAESPEPEVDTTPEAMAIWYASHPGLSLTNHQTVAIGGLEGIAFDVALAAGYGETCWYTHAGEALVPLLIGTGPAGLHHVVNGSFTTRLYLLTGPTGRVIAIEVVDHPEGLTLDDLSDVVETIEFGSEPPLGVWSTLTLLDSQEVGTDEAAYIHRLFAIALFAPAPFVRTSP